MGGGCGDVSNCLNSQFLCKGALLAECFIFHWKLPSCRRRRARSPVSPLPSLRVKCRGSVRGGGTAPQSTQSHSNLGFITSPSKALGSDLPAPVSGLAGPLAEAVRLRKVFCVSSLEAQKRLVAKFFTVALPPPVPASAWGSAKLICRKAITGPRVICLPGRWVERAVITGLVPRAAQYSDCRAAAAC